MTRQNFDELTAADIHEQLCNLDQLTFEITDACNLNCKYCGYGEFYNDYDTRTNHQLNHQYAINLINYLVRLWNSNSNYSHQKVVYISFYGGEPLLNMEFIKLIVHYIESLHSKNIRFKYSITTNGILLDKYMDFLVEQKFNILISLDGNKSNNAYRVNHNGVNSFDKIYTNAKLLERMHPDFFVHNVYFNSVLHNKNNVPELVTFFKREFNKTPRITELNKTGIRHDKHEEFDRMYNNKYHSISGSKKEYELPKELIFENPKTTELNIFLHQHSENVFFSYNDLLATSGKTKKIPTGTCLPFGKKLFVTVNGKILVCERIGHQFAAGKISENGIELDFEDIANKYNGYYESLKSQCSKCYRLKTCTQCIFSMETKNQKLYCKHFMNKEQFNRYKNALTDYLRNNPELYTQIMTEVTVN
ncbi:MAG: radical SAM peptide maturase [Marinifilaceae bacterium]